MRKISRTSPTAPAQVQGVAEVAETGTARTIYDDASIYAVFL
jgi:hypothetical protein